MRTDRALALKARSHLRQRVAILGRPVVDHADRKLPDQFTAQRTHLCAEIFECRREVLACLVDGLSLVGQPKADPSTLAESHAETPFEIADLPADGRLADVQGNLCGGETATLGHRHENRKQMKISLVETWNGGCALLHHA